MTLSKILDQHPSYNDVYLEAEYNREQRALKENKPFVIETIYFNGRGYLAVCSLHLNIEFNSRVDYYPLPTITDYVNLHNQLMNSYSLKKQIPIRKMNQLERYNKKETNPILVDSIKLAIGQF